MFYVSKLVGLFLLPSNLIALLGLLGVLAVLFGRRRLGLSLLILSTVLLVTGGWSPAGRAALVVLEDRFPQPQLSGPVTGIVMLGGAVDTHITAERGQPALNQGGERVTAVAELSRQFPRARLLLSGGASDVLTRERVTESAVARDLLVRLGVESQRIELEENSRTTCENAEQSLPVAKPQAGDRWLLVTSASHMPRAVACFRAAGFSVIPYPVDYRTRGASELRRPDTIAAGLEALDLAAHEWIGLAGYRLSGRTGEWFPSP